MPQGKLKVKTKVPSNIKTKKKSKGPAVSKRGNAPITPKKQKLQETHKLKKIITKNVNRAVEAEIRARASEDVKMLSNAQKAVAAHNLKQK